MGNNGAQDQRRRGRSSRNMGGRSNYVRFMALLRDFPPEICTFLKGQMHRCLVYPGDTDDFWQQLKAVIMEEL